MVESFRRRSNLQLGGRHEYQGSLGRAGWHRWRLRGNTESSTSIPLFADPPPFSTSYPPSPPSTDNSAMSQLRKLVNGNEDRLLGEGFAVSSSDRSEEKVLNSHSNCDPKNYFNVTEKSKIIMYIYFKNYCKVSCINHFLFP